MSALLFLVVFVVGVTAICGAFRMYPIIDDSSRRSFISHSFLVSVAMLLLIGGLAAAFFGMVRFGSEVWSYITVAGL